MKVGIFNASNYTLAEAIQQNAIKWIDAPMWSRCI